MSSTDAYSMLCYGGVEFNGVPAEGFALEKTAVEVIVKFGCSGFSISLDRNYTYVIHEKFTLSSYRREYFIPNLERIISSKDRCDREIEASSLVEFLVRNIRTVEERGWVKFAGEVEILDSYKRQKTLETLESGIGEAEFYVKGRDILKAVPFLKNRKKVSLNYTAEAYTPVNFSFEGGRVYIAKADNIKEY